MKSTFLAALILCVGCVACSKPADDGNAPAPADPAKEKALAERKVLEDPYKEGKAPALEGPFVEAGKVDDLHFNAVALGQAKNLTLSEDGDLLYRTAYTGDQKNSTGETLNFTFSLRSKDGSTKTFSGADRVYMLPNGAVFQASMEGKSKDHLAKILLPNGTTLETDAKTPFGFNMVREQNVEPCSQGFSDRASQLPKVFEYDDVNLKHQSLPLTEVQNFYISAASTQLGDLGYGLDDKGYITKFGTLKDGKITFEDIPVPHDTVSICAGKGAVAVTAGKHSFDHNPYLKGADGKYTRLGVPKGVVGARVTAINSKGDYILVTEGPGMHEGRRNSKSYDSASYLVTGGKYYDLSALAKKLFTKEEDSGLSISTSLFDEKGDLVAEAGGGGRGGRRRGGGAPAGGGNSYLLVRQ